MRYENPYGSGYKIRKMDDESGYLIHRVEDQNFLAHHGVKGQKWGVITKEYEPVAVDHRKIKRFSPIAKARARMTSERAKAEAERQQERENWNAIFEKKRRNKKAIASVMGVGVMALSLYGGYKLNKIHGRQLINGKAALKNLLPMKPSVSSFKNAAKTLGKEGINYSWGKSLAPSGLKRVKSTFDHAKVLLTGQRYREYVKKARRLIGRVKNRDAS